MGKGIKKSILLGLTLCFFFYLSAVVLATGLSPSRMELSFEPNSHKEFIIGLINSGTSYLNASLELHGDLAEYFKVEEGYFIIPPQQVKQYKITVDFPNTVKRPGKHIMRYSAIQGPLQMKGIVNKGISATVSVHGELVVTVPYSGRYAEATLSLQDVNEGEESLATFTLTNYGLQDIKQAYATLEIYDTDGKILDTLHSDSISLPSQQTESLTIPLDSQKYGPGIFPVSGFVKYDTLVTDPVSEELRIGQLNVSILNYTSEVFAKKISVFELQIRNLWNNNIENVYAEIRLFKDNIPVTEIMRTPAVTIPPWGLQVISAFLDATRLDPGLYEAHITLYYQGKIMEVVLPVTIKKRFELNTAMILVGVILLMLLIDIIVWIIHKRRKNEDDY